jgi:uncharacterized membrane protein YhfC
MIQNWPLFFTYVAAIVIEIGMPVTLAILIIKKMKVHWLVILTGVLTFIGSQVVHIPLLYIPNLLQKLGMQVTLPASWPIWLYAIYLGLYAGLCEETARWVGYRLLKSKAASYKSAFGLGIGHGGVESVLVGVVVMASLLSVLFFNPNNAAAQGMSEGSVQMSIAQIASFWTTPWHMPLAGAVERVTAVSAQLLMSVFVWKAVTKKSWLWYLLAVGYHALIDGTSVMLLSWTSNAWLIEASLSIFLVIDVVFLILFWKSEKRKELADTPVLESTQNPL